MAKNYAGTGDTVTFVAPAGGAVAGEPLALNDLVVIPLQDGAKGAVLVGRTNGVWTLATAVGLKRGQKVSALAGALVAPGTEGAMPFGKLMSDVVGGYADAMLVQQ